MSTDAIAWNATSIIMSIGRVQWQMLKISISWRSGIKIGTGRNARAAIAYREQTSLTAAQTLLE
ncbi:hypothetical protein [Pendulispora albinea]|uniref:Uncharacterized protein n=1 Tax=Pendulispora albinea TaxID=2741071 RepID=A0ABZ2M3W4_9BACT